MPRRIIQSWYTDITGHYCGQTSASLLMDGLLHLVQCGGAWAGCGPTQSLPHCTKCNNPPINGRCTNHCIAIWWSAVLIWRLRVNALCFAVSCITRLYHLNVWLSPLLVLAPNIASSLKSGRFQAFWLLESVNWVSKSGYLYPAPESWKRLNGAGRSRTGA